MKVFSLEAYKRSMQHDKKNRAKALELGWPQRFDGKTEEEIKQEGCIVHPAWMIEKEQD